MIAKPFPNFGTCLELNNEKTARIIKIYIYPTGLRAGLLPGPTYERSRGKVEKRWHLHSIKIICRFRIFRWTAPDGSVRTGQSVSQLKQASLLTREVKISLILVPGYASMPDIKLTRTDTTHDLSQKAEKWQLNLFLILVHALNSTMKKQLAS